MLERLATSVRLEVKARRSGQVIPDFRIQSATPAQLVNVSTTTPELTVTLPITSVQVVVIVSSLAQGQSQLAQCGATVGGTGSGAGPATPAGPGITPPPIILSFALNGGNPNVASGATIQAEWATLGATGCVLHQPAAIGNVEVPAQGTRPIGPIVNPGGQPLPLGFKLSCTGAGGVAETPVLNIVVAPPPPPVIGAFTVTENIPSGGNITVQWSSVGATGCALTQADTIGTVQTPATGSQNFGPITNTTTAPRTLVYTLRCTGPGGYADASPRNLVVAPACVPREQTLLDRFPHNDAVIATVRLMFTMDPNPDNVFRNEAATAEKICLAHGFNSVKTRDSRHRDGRYNFTSPGDNYHYRWNGQKFEKAPAWGGQWLATLVCAKVCQ